MPEQSSILGEVLLVRETGARRVLVVPDPPPDTLSAAGVRYVYNRFADVIDGRPRYVEVPEASPLVRLCLHGCPGCGAVEPCGENPCWVGTGQARRCAACVAC